MTLDNQGVADAARAYVAAWHSNLTADASRWLSARCELDRCQDLLFTACGYGGYGSEDGG